MSSEIQPLLFEFLCTYHEIIPLCQMSKVYKNISSNCRDIKVEFDFTQHQIFCLLCIFLMLFFQIEPNILLVALDTFLLIGLYRAAM